MAQHEANHSLSILLGLVLAVILAVGAVAWFAAQVEPLHAVDDSSFAFEPLTIDEAKLASQRKSIAADIPDEAKPKIVALEKAIAEANAAQFGPLMLPNNRFEVAVQFAADDAATAVPDGYNRFVSLSGNVTQTCLNSLEEVQRALKGGSLTLDEVTKGIPAGFEVYARTCGNALPQLIMIGLVDDKGQWVDESGPVMMEIFSRLRFAHIMSLRKDPRQLLTPYERELILRWKLTSPKTQQADRIKAITELKELVPGYPEHEARGRVYFGDGNFVRAKEEFDIACAARRSDQQLQRYCQYLAKKVGAEVH